MASSEPVSSTADLEKNRAFMDLYSRQIGAFGLDFWKNRALIGTEAGIDIAIGFALAFISAFFVIRYALDFIQRHGFAPFAYWRIFIGAIGLWGVLLFK